jgi:DNA-binding Lrp family transcriptional regulator
MAERLSAATRAVRTYNPPMPVNAYVLIQTDVNAAEVAALLRGVGGIESADDVSGPYDVIARVEAPDLDHLGRLVVSEIQKIDGVTRTLTCPIVTF